MARPLKEGLSYYNIDTDRYQDIKIKRLKHSFGSDGICIYDYVLCEIYRVKGYFLRWDAVIAFDISDYWNIPEEKVNEIIRFCGAIDLFHSPFLTDLKILTSRSIQERYVLICKNSNRKNWFITKSIELTTQLIELTTQLIVVNEIESTQSKVKESKVKESKVNYYFKIRDQLIPNTPISNFLEENYQITLDQYCMVNDSAKKFYKQVMEKMNTDYAGYNFRDDNHLQNSFKFTYEKLIKNGNNKKHSGNNQIISQCSGFGTL